MRKQLEKLLSEIVGELYTQGQIAVMPSVEISKPDPKFGDYSTNVALKLAKTLKQNPKEVAEKIINRLKALDKAGDFAAIDQAAGFINITLSEKVLSENLKKILDQEDLFGASIIGGGKTVIVEYFQLNIAKQPHVGHMRSAVIGDAIKRIIKSQGYKVLSDTHVGDWGTQFGIMIAAYKRYGKPENFEQEPLEELEKLYVRYNEEMESNPDLREVGKQEFAQLEQGDTENRWLWQLFNDVSMAKLHEAVELLQLEKFELHLGESFYENKMQAILDDMAKKNLIKKDETGALLVDLSEYNLDQGILKKSDGATTYLLRDLAKIQYVWQVYAFEKNIYIVDVRQSHHFRQLFKIAELAGWEGAAGSFHIDYGLMRLPEGMLSTRKGNVISLEKLISEATERAQKIIDEKNPELKNKEHVARQVALAAIKYFDLLHNAKSDIVFSWERSLTFEGNTGPYLQYTHARIHGILRKSADHTTPSASQPPLLSKEGSGPYSPPGTGGVPDAVGGGGRHGGGMNDHELSVLRKLIQFPEILEQITKDYLPNLLCNYLFELSQTFNSFYQEVPVTQETDDEKKSFRLQLITATAQVIKNGLYLLGIEAPEEM